jgi:hypothetical protein
MKKSYKLIAVAIAGIFTLNCNYVSAGNPDRAGQSGATELLINPWVRSSGWAGSNMAGVRGLESMFTNVAGTAFTKKTEVLLARTQYLKGTDININAFGLTQHVGATGCIGLAVTSMRFGDIPVTTSDLPEGTGYKYTPSFMNIALSYAKGFSDNIYGGLAVKVITEKISNVSARGVALDAGIQYVTGKHQQLKFGIALKNVGPKMKYSGDGLSFKTPVPASTTNTTMTVDQRASQFELPSLLSIGAGYDLYVLKDTANMKKHRVTIMGAFVSNTFSKDQFNLGLEYAWHNMLMLRVGYNYEKGITKSDTRTTVYTGPTAGITLEAPFNKSKSTFGLDFSYRATNPFSGIFAIGARMNL